MESQRPRSRDSRSSRISCVIIEMSAACATCDVGVLIDTGTLASPPLACEDAPAVPRLSVPTVALLCLPLMWLLVGCASLTPAADMPAASGDVLYVVRRGWHIDVGVRADALAPPLDALRGQFPGVR